MKAHDSIIFTTDFLQNNYKLLKRSQNKMTKWQKRKWPKDKKEND